MFADAGDSVDIILISRDLLDVIVHGLMPVITNGLPGLWLPALPPSCS
jgi:hypothetical protein